METVEEYNHAKKQLMGLDKSVLVNALLQLALELNSVSRASCKMSDFN